MPIIPPRPIPTITQVPTRRFFLDSDNRDYRRKPGSPPINARTETDAKEDIEGNPVPQGEATDIGAYDFGPNRPRYRPGHAAS